MVDSPNGQVESYNDNSTVLPQAMLTFYIMWLVDF